jgi:hypothetical protein
MKVYIIKGYWDYEGSDIIGIELDQEKAIQLAEAEFIAGPLGYHYDGIFVELWDDRKLSTRTNSELESTLSYADEIWRKER